MGDRCSAPVGRDTETTDRRVDAHRSPAQDIGGLAEALESGEPAGKRWWASSGWPTRGAGGGSPPSAALLAPWPAMAEVGSRVDTAHVNDDGFEEF